MSAEKRKVSTDALETLGTIITEGDRDAIHLAVEPVVAGESIVPGENLVIIDGKAYPAVHNPLTKSLGIADPLLKERVKAGEKFWLIVYPRQITSLRHVWSHPDFPEGEHQVDPEIINRVIDKLAGGSEKFIRSFAADLNITYEALMSAADRWHESGDYTYDNDENYKDHWDKFDEFWKHYEKLTGKTVADKSSFFTCSC